MFTGLVEATGEVVALTAATGQGSMTRLLLQASNLTSSLGDSIAVNGCCLTLAATPGDHQLAFDLSRETLACTTLGALAPGQQVNLERAVSLSSRLGGHLVSGHVDLTAEVIRLSPAGSGWLLEVAFPASAAGYLIPKGSLCLNGVSLTINRVEARGADGLVVSLMLIPTTLAKTTLASLRAGEPINAEYDVIAKYVAALVAPYLPPPP